MRLSTFFFLTMIILGAVLAWKTLVPKVLPEFEAVLFQIDTTELTSLSWQNTKGEFILVREENKWLITHGTRTVEALPKTVSKLLQPLQKVQTYDMVAQQSSAWKNFGMDEAQATRVQLYQKGEMLEDFWLSPLTVKDSLHQLLTYVRLAGEDEVFEVSGELSRAFQLPFHRFRDPTVLRLDSLIEITALEYFLSPDSSLYFAKADHWQHENYAPLLDSTIVKTFLKNLETVESTAFADNFDDTRTTEFFHRAIALQLAHLPKSIRLECYRDSTWQQPFVIHSSQNPGNYFASDSSGLYQYFFGVFEKELTEVPEE